MPTTPKTLEPAAAPEPARPDLSIVTVSYNSEDHLLACLHSVAHHTHATRFEHIVVDNASEDRSILERVRRDLPETILIESPRNLGFAGGCNLGLERARGRYVLLLNPDTRVDEGALDEMAGFLEAHPDVAVLGSPLYHADGRDLRCAGRAFPTPLLALFGRTTLLTRLLPGNRLSERFAQHHDSERAEPYPVDWVSGACMMVRREAIEAVGPIDPDFFFMWEDADWCYRMHQAGWKVYCHHEAKVVHVEGSSRNRNWRSLWISTLGFHRGAYRYYRKHMNPRRFDPIHLLVMAGLSARALLLLAGRSAARIARLRPGPPPAGPERPESRESPVTR